MTSSPFCTRSVRRFTLAVLLLASWSLMLLTTVQAEQNTDVADATAADVDAAAVVDPEVSDETFEFLSGLNETTTAASTTTTTSTEKEQDEEDVHAIVNAVTNDTSTTTIPGSNITTSTKTDNFTISNDTTVVVPISVTEIQYELPSFSLTLQVTDIENNQLIDFQDRLQQQIQWHLEDFFQAKLETTTSLDQQGSSSRNQQQKLRVGQIDLQSQLVWRELAVDTQLYESSNNLQDGTHEQHIEKDSELKIKMYEVRGTYDCDISLLLERYEQTEVDNNNENNNDLLGSALGVSSTMMNLFFIEAFQGERYWELIHRFMADDELHDLRDIKIVVLEGGFVPYHGQTLDDDFYSTATNDSISAGAIVGVAVGTLFCIALIGVMIFLFCMVPGTYLYNLHMNAHFSNIGGSSVCEKGSETDDACSTNSSPSEVDEESARLDAWATSITSIPLRELSNDTRVKRKKKRGAPILQSFVRPAHEHMSSLELDCIDESDSESVASSVASSRTKDTASVKTARRSNRSKTKDPSGVSPIAEQQAVSFTPRANQTTNNNRNDHDGGAVDDLSLSSGVTIWDDATSVNSEGSSMR